MNRSEAFAAIRRERQRQLDKWDVPHPWGQGDCSNPTLPDILKATVLTEETGEVARAVLEQDDAQLQTELVQVAAVAVAWLESFDTI